jgi:putative transposase
MALGVSRRSEVFHSDQVCEFSSSDFGIRLKAEEIKISGSERKRCYDNILLPGSGAVNYEDVYLHAYSHGWDAESAYSIPVHVLHVRPYSSLGGRTPIYAFIKFEGRFPRPELTMSGAKTAQ